MLLVMKSGMVRPFILSFFSTLFLLLSACSKIGFMKVETVTDPSQNQSRKTLASSLIPTRIEITGNGATVLERGVCASFSAITRSTSGVQSGVQSNLEFALSSSLQGTFYSDSSCSQAASNFTIKTGFSVLQFYFRAQEEGVTQIAAATKGFTSVTGGPSVFSVNFLIQNTRPRGENGTFVVEEDQSLTGSVIVDDANGDAVQVYVQDMPAHTSAGGNFVPPTSGGVFSYKADPNYSGSDVFTYFISDGKSFSDVRTVVLNISPVQDAPILASNAPLTVPENGSQTLSNAHLQTTDVDNPPPQTLVYTLNSLPANGWIKKNLVPLAHAGTFTQGDIDSGAIRYVHNGSETTSDAFNFSVSDGQGGVILNQTFHFSITPTNDSPAIAVNTGMTVNEGTVPPASPVANVISNAMLKVVDADLPAATTLRFTLAVKPARGFLKIGGTLLGNGSTFTQADIDAGLLSYTHGGSETTSDGFSFSVSDSQGGSIGLTGFFIHILPVNDQPIKVSSSFILNENTTKPIARGHLEYVDADGAPSTLLYKILSLPVNGILKKEGQNLAVQQTFTQADINASRISYTHQGSETTSDQFTYSLTDGQGGEIPSSIFSITVLPVNDPPVANAQSVTTNEDTAVSGTLSGSDPENSPLTYLIVSQGTKGTASVVAATGAFTYTPNPNANGADTFIFRVRDAGNVSSTSATVSVNILSVNDAPSVSPLTVGTGKNQNVNIVLSATDVDLDALTFSFAQPTQNGGSTTLVASNGNSVTIRYSPPPLFSGTDTFTYKARDNGVSGPKESMATVTVLVDPTPQVNSPSLCLGSQQTAWILPSQMQILVPGISTAPSDQIFFTLVRSPEQGVLKRTGQQGNMEVGGTFTLEELETHSVYYETKTHGENDQFSFTVDYRQDGNASNPQIFLVEPPNSLCN